MYALPRLSRVPCNSHCEILDRPCRNSPEARYGTKIYRRQFLPFRLHYYNKTGSPCSTFARSRNHGATMFAGEALVRTSVCRLIVRSIHVPADSAISCGERLRRSRSSSLASVTEGSHHFVISVQCGLKNGCRQTLKEIDCKISRENQTFTFQGGVFSSGIDESDHFLSERISAGLKRGQVC